MCLVPTARLELAQLSPLPPQDSVSTNFTTSAYLTEEAASRDCETASLTALEFTLKRSPFQPLPCQFERCQTRLLHN